MNEDLFESAKQTWAERLASPLLGGFVASWGLWNWKFLVILFSEASVKTTFKLVETVAFPDLTSKVLYGFLFPLASALAYVFVYPYPALKIYEFTLKMQRTSNEVKQRISDGQLLTEKQTVEFREKYRELDRAKDNELKELQAEVARYKKEVVDLKLQIPEKKPNKLSDSQIMILKALRQAHGEIRESELIRIVGLDKLQADYDLFELTKNTLVKISDKYANSSRVVELTQNGRRCVLQNSI
jgi:hypothetical protein